jgi:hypothetical protein
MFDSDYGGCDIQAHIELVNKLNIIERYKELIKLDNAINFY